MSLNAMAANCELMSLCKFGRYHLSLIVLLLEIIGLSDNSHRCIL